MSKNKAVFGIYSSEAQASEGVDQLRLAGFQNTEVSVLFSENAGNKDLALTKNSKAPEGATAGVSTGGFLGGAFGWLVGIGALAIPGIGPFIAAGPIMAALAGAAGGAAAGGLTGALIGMGIPEYEAKRYEGKVKDGNILLSVHTDDNKERDRAKKIFEAGGAVDISYTGEASVPKEHRPSAH